MVFKEEGHQPGHRLQSCSALDIEANLPVFFRILTFTFTRWKVSASRLGWLRCRGNQMRLLCLFMTDEAGNSAVEYALIAGLIALGMVGGATALGTSINQTFTNVATSLR